MFESSKYAEDLTNVQCTLLLVSILDIISCTCTMQYTWQPLHSHYTRSTSLKMQETLSLRVYICRRTVNAVQTGQPRLRNLVN